LWRLFEQAYIQGQPLTYHSHHLSEAETLDQIIAASLRFNDRPILVHGYGNGPIDAFLNGLNLDLSVHHYEERSLTQGSDAVAIAVVELRARTLANNLHGVGIHANIVTASLMAILSAINREAQVNSVLRSRLCERFKLEQQTSLHC
jgi:2-isopropylmalate synthase